jgi:hypothetical protein
MYSIINEQANWNGKQEPLAEDHENVIPSFKDSHVDDCVY